MACNYLTVDRNRLRYTLRSPLNGVGVGVRENAPESDSNSFNMKASDFKCLKLLIKNNKIGLICTDNQCY